MIGYTNNSLIEVVGVYYGVTHECAVNQIFDCSICSVYVYEISFEFKVNDLYKTRGGSAFDENIFYKF